MISAIILAAGESRRMGELKPVIKINGKTFLRHITDQLEKAGIKKIFIVTGYEASRIEKESGVANASFVVNEHYRSGQFSSLQIGIRQLNAECRAVVVCLADQPHIKAEWVRRMVAAFEKTGAPIVTPKCRMKRGHPIIFSAALFKEIKKMRPTQTAHDLKEGHYDEIVDVPIDDEGLIVDADTLEDLSRVKDFFDQ